MRHGDEVVILPAGARGTTHAHRDTEGHIHTGTHTRKHARTYTGMQRGETCMRHAVINRPSPSLQNIHAAQPLLFTLSCTQQTHAPTAVYRDIVLNLNIRHARRPASQPASQPSTASSSSSSPSATTNTSQQHQPCRLLQHPLKWNPCQLLTEQLIHGFNGLQCAAPWHNCHFPDCHAYLKVSSSL